MTIYMDVMHIYELYFNLKHKQFPGLIFSFMHGYAQDILIISGCYLTGLTCIWIMKQRNLDLYHICNTYILPIKHIISLSHSPCDHSSSSVHSRASSKGASSTPQTPHLPQWTLGVRQVTRSCRLGWRSPRHAHIGRQDKDGLHQ